MIHDKDDRLDVTDRLDELENTFERVTGQTVLKVPDLFAKASALAMLSLAIDSAREVVADAERAEEAESAALKVNVQN